MLQIQKHQRRIGVLHDNANNDKKKNTYPNTFSKHPGHTHSLGMLISITTASAEVSESKRAP